VAVSSGAVIRAGASAQLALRAVRRYGERKGAPSPEASHRSSSLCRQLAPALGLFRFVRLLGALGSVGTFRSLGACLPVVRHFVRLLRAHHVAKLEAHAVRDLPPALAAGALLQDFGERALELFGRRVSDALLLEL